MASLLEELAGRNLWFSPGLPGRRVTFALDGELADERKAVEVEARRVAALSADGPRPNAGHLIRLALRDGRARYESDIVQMTTLRPITVEQELRRMRKAGDAESIHVGRHKLWALTSRPEAPEQR